MNLLDLPKNEEIVTARDAILRMRVWMTYLVDKWKTIAIVAIAGALIGLSMVYNKKTIYTATLSFAMEDERAGGLGSAMGLASQFGLDLGASNAGGAFASANLIELMQSRSIVEKALLDSVKNQGQLISLAQFYINITGIKNVWKKAPDTITIQPKLLPGSDRKGFDLMQNSILAAIYEQLLKYHLKVYQRDRKISILAIEVKSENELFSKSFTEALANEVSKFYIDTKTHKSSQNLAILQKQADSVRRELNYAITGFAEANDNVYNLNPGLNVKRVPSTKRQIDIQANTAILTELLKNIELAKIAVRKETPLIQIIDTPILPLNEERPDKIKAMIIGVILGGMIAVIYLVLSRLWRVIMAAQS